MNAPAIITQIQEVENGLTAMIPEVKVSLPTNITPEKFMRIAMTAIENNPDLLQCNRASLYIAIKRCAQDGLIPDGREAALVKFGDKVTYMPMVGGILKKVRNSGELSMITAQIVYEADDFKFWVDETGEHIKHEPNMFVSRGKIYGAYAMARTKDGAAYIEVMTEEEIMKVKDVSRSKDKGPWSGPFSNEMRKKTVIRRLSKRLPMSTDLEQVIHADDEIYETEAVVKSEEPETTSSRLRNVIEATATTPSTPEAEQPVDVEEQPPTHEPYVEGLIEKIDAKSGTTNGKNWTKFTAKIKDIWLTTFSSSINDEIISALDNRRLVRIYYTSKEVKGKDGNTVLSNTISRIETVTTDTVPV